MIPAGNKSDKRPEKRRNAEKQREYDVMVYHHWVHTCVSASSSSKQIWLSNVSDAPKQPEKSQVRCP